jgi:hypothetical protein
MKRTGAMVILSIVSVVAGIVAIFDAIRYLEIIGTPLDFFVASWFGAALSGLVALIWFATAVQIWNGDPRGWLFMVSIAAIFLIFDIFSLIAGTPWELLSTSVIVSALALILGLLPSTKREFGQTAE